MSATATALPVRTPPARAASEALVIGGVLHLQLSLSDLEASGLGAEDFKIDLWRKALQIARKRAERRDLVSAETVAMAGLRASWFTQSEREQLEAQAYANTLTREAWFQVANDFRLMSRAADLATALEAEVRSLRSGGFNPARTASNLEQLAQQLQRDTAPDEDAAGDVVELLEDWDTNETEKTSRLFPTRIAQVDEAIGGMPWGLTVILARAGVGKTAVLDSMIRAQLEADENVHLGFFGLEDGTSHIVRRWMAHDTGMLLREVGWKERTDDQRKASKAMAEHYTRLLRRLHVYRHDTIGSKDLVARIAAMKAKFNIAAAYVDNLFEVDLRAPQQGRFQPHDKEHQLLSELGRRLRNLGMRERFPIGLITHTIGEIGEGQIPTQEDIAGGQALAKRVRLLLSLWEKGEELRCTIGKANELGARGITVAFARLKEAGLIDPTAGHKVNLQAERAADRKAREDEKEAAVELRRKKREETRQKERELKAAAEAKAKEDADPQESLGIDLEEANRKAKEAAVERPDGWGMRWTSEEPNADE